MPIELKSGLYDYVITRELSIKLAAISDNCKTITDIHTDRAHHTLALHLARIIAPAIAAIAKKHGEDAEGRNVIAQRQSDLCNEILGVVAKYDDRISLEANHILDELKCLLEIKDVGCGTLQRPDIPLTQAALFTGIRGDLNFESELIKEIRSANRIDIICSFIKWSGLRLIKDALSSFLKRPESSLRIITTSYLGATEPRALEFLRSLAQTSDTNIRVSYDTKLTRLHAKAYIFHRDSNFGSAYVGSSNLSNPALTSGLEWNLKISQYESPSLWEKVCATFETYLHENDFQPYKTEDDKKRFEDAIKQECFGNKDDDRALQFFVDLAPYPYQQEILDKIDVERKIHNFNRNLLVAATGMGKTIIAAFDFKKHIMRDIQSPRMLFIAHREEILSRSRATFRMVLRNHNFGELWVGDHIPNGKETLFASIQTLNAKQIWEQLPTDFYDYIIVDECHHSPGRTYSSVLSYFKPKYLLGLTATPERTDGQNIERFFDNRKVANIRLPEAINRKLLCPFQYFGISDPTDFSNIPWVRGKYEDAALGRLINNNQQRAELILEKTADIVSDVRRIRALCFCASVEHAMFMNKFFNEKGIPSELLVGETDSITRRTIQSRLEAREINVICVVDIYNEGVDIPFVDTVLFLRPTESLTVFLQQLGRGLRHDEGKDCLTVLDFVGNANKNFRFDLRFRALIGDSGVPIYKEVENDFVHLPAGCHIFLEKEAQKTILANISRNIAGAGKPQLVSSLRTFKEESGQELTLANFLDYHELELQDVYKSKASFSRLCAEAFDAYISDVLPDDRTFSSGIVRISHINSTLYIRTIQRLLVAGHKDLEGVSEEEKRLLTMFSFSLFGSAANITTPTAIIRELKRNDEFYKETQDVMEILDSRIERITHKPHLPFENCPLELHANYSRDEILVALGQHRRGSMTGVEYIKAIKTDVFFITINKANDYFTPTTSYDDYAESETLFHWQSQAATKADSPIGQRYINHMKLKSTVLLFVRENKRDSRGTESFCFLGPANYVSHYGSKPISILWELENPMPASVARFAKRMAI